MNNWGSSPNFYVDYSTYTSGSSNSWTGDSWAWDEYRRLAELKGKKRQAQEPPKDPDMEWLRGRVSEVEEMSGIAA